MSENLDLVRSIVADFERGDFSWPESADPEMEFVVAAGPEPASRTGLDARPGAGGVLNSWHSLRFEANEYRELGDGRVLVFYRIRGRGKGSGVEVDQSRASLFDLDKGKVTRVVFYWDPDRALADLGLKE